MSAYTPRHKKGSKKFSVPAMLVIDILLTGIALVIFALFHHVLPSSLGSQAGTTVIQPQTVMMSQGYDSSPSSNQSSAYKEPLPAPQDAIDTSTIDEGTQSSTTQNESVIGIYPETQENHSSPPQDTTAPSPTGNEDAKPAGKFDHLFTDEVIITESSYSSSDIYISISEHVIDNSGDQITYYVADIYLKDIRCFQSYFAGNKFHRGGYAYDLLQLDKDANAIVAINGDYFSYQAGTCVLRNGVLYRYPAVDADVCVLNYDGTMVTYRANELQTSDQIDAALANAWQGWSFGPALLDKDGQVFSDLATYTTIGRENPRTGIGYYEPGHYCFVVVDGRQAISAGARIEVFAQIFCDLGCTAAYNMDGGGSSAMSYNDEFVSNPFDIRKLPDIVLITEYEGSVAQAALETEE